VSKIVFEVEMEAKDACDMKDAEAADNVCDLILDALGFPDGVKVSAKVLRREP